MMGCLKKLWQDDSGVSAVEYALIAALIAVAIIAGARLLGTSVNSKFNEVANEIDNA